MTLFQKKKKQKLNVQSILCEINKKNLKNNGFLFGQPNIIFIFCVKIH